MSSARNHMKRSHRSHIYDKKAMSSYKRTSYMKKAHNDPIWVKYLNRLFKNKFGK